MAEEISGRKYGVRDATNFLKALELLFCVRDALSPFCLRIAEELQRDILKKLKIAYGATCDTCKDKVIKSVNFQCQHPENICQKIARQIDANKSKDVQIYLKNSNVAQWSQEGGAWEIAKVYMGSGQMHDNDGPDKTDSSGILHLLKNCKAFEKFHNSCDIKMLIDLRNDVAHASKSTYSCSKLDEYIHKFSQFLSQLSVHQHLKPHEKDDITRAVQQMEHLKGEDPIQYIYKYHRLQPGNVLELISRLPVSEMDDEFCQGVMKITMRILREHNYKKIRSRRQTSSQYTDKWYDIYMIYCDTHKELAIHITQLLIKHVKLPDGELRILTDFDDMDCAFGKPIFNLLEEAVMTSHHAFVLCNKGSGFSEFQASCVQLAELENLGIIVFPLKTGNNSCLSACFMPNPVIDVTPLLALGVNQDPTPDAKKSLDDIRRYIDEGREVVERSDSSSPPQPTRGTCGNSTI